MSGKETRVLQEMQFVIIEANILNIRLKARGLSSIWLVSPAELQALGKMLEILHTS